MMGTTTFDIDESLTQLRLFAVQPSPCLDIRYQNGSLQPRGASWHSPRQGTYSNSQLGSQPPRAAKPVFSDHFKGVKQLIDTIDVGAQTSRLDSLAVAQTAVESTAAEHNEVPNLPSAESSTWYFSKESHDKLWNCTVCRCASKGVGSPTLFAGLLQCDHLRLLRGQLPAASLLWPEHGTNVNEIPTWNSVLRSEQFSGLCFVCRAPLASWLVIEQPALSRFFVTSAVQPCMTADGIAQRWAPWRGMVWEGPTPLQLRAVFGYSLTLSNCVKTLSAAFEIALSWSRSQDDTASAGSDARILANFLNYYTFQSRLISMHSRIVEPAARAQSVPDSDAASNSSSSYGGQKRRRPTRNMPQSALASASKKPLAMQPAVQYREALRPRRVLSKVQAATEMQTVPFPIRRLMRYDWRSGEWIARARTPLGELEVNGTSAFMAALTRDYVRAVELNVQPHLIEKQRKYWLVLQSQELQDAFVNVELPTDPMSVRLRLSWKGPNPDEIGAQCERMPQHEFVNIDNWAEITRAATAQRIKFHEMLVFKNGDPLWGLGLPDGLECGDTDSDAESLQSLSEPHVAAQAADIAAAAERDQEWQEAADGNVVQSVAAAAFLLCGLVDGSDDEGGGPPPAAQAVGPPQAVPGMATSEAPSNAESDVASHRTPVHEVALRDAQVHQRDSPVGTSGRTSAARVL
jgi:hypothetical protein